MNPVSISVLFYRYNRANIIHNCDRCCQYEFNFPALPSLSNLTISRLSIRISNLPYLCLMKYIFPFVLFICIGCGATQPIRVLEEGKTNAVLSLGGPVMELGTTPIVVPYLTVGVMNGLTHNLTLTANAHIVSAIFGDIGLDAGLALRMVKQDGIIPEVTSKVQFYLFDNLANGTNSPRLFPNVALNGSYLIGESSLIYVGVDNVFELSKPSYIISPFIGTEFYISQRISGQLEAKWIAANVMTSHGILEGYAAIGGTGNIGLYLGLIYSF